MTSWRRITLLKGVTVAAYGLTSLLGFGRDGDELRVLSLLYAVGRLAERQSPPLIR